MKKVVIFGLGRISDVVYHHFVRDCAFDVVGFTCDKNWIDESSAPAGRHCGLPVFPFEEIRELAPPSVVSMFIAIGYHNLNAVREKKCTEAKAMGYELISYVSKHAHCGPWLKIGENCLILDGVGIQPGVDIGNNVSIWNNSLIGHHSKIGNHCWIAAGATLGGIMTLGERSFVGLNATIGGDLNIGSECFFGAGTVVVKSAEPRSVFIDASTPKFRLSSDAFIRLSRMQSLGPVE